MDVFGTLITPLIGFSFVMLLLLGLIGFIRTQIKQAQDQVKKQVCCFNDLAQDIQTLSIDKQQSLFTYANESLARARHLEISMRTKAVPLYPVGLIILLLSIATIFLIKIPLIYLMGLLILDLVLVHSIWKLGSIQTEVATNTDSFSKSYMDTIQTNLKS